MTNDRLKFCFLNIGHFLDHVFMLIFATVAASATFGAVRMLPRTGVTIALSSAA